MALSAYSLSAPHSSFHHGHHTNTADMSFDQCDKTKDFADEVMPTILSEDMDKPIRYAAHRAFPKDDRHREAQDIRVLASRECCF